MSEDTRGFAGMDKAKQREIASKGGQASGGKNLERVDRSEAGRKGGEAVSKDRAHMAAIGRKGGEAVSRNRAHMAEIGRRGGEARGQNAHRREEDMGPPRREDEGSNRSGP